MRKVQGPIGNRQLARGYVLKAESGELRAQDLKAAMICNFE